MLAVHQVQHKRQHCSIVYEHPDQRNTTRLSLEPCQVIEICNIWTWRHLSLRKKTLWKVLIYTMVSMMRGFAWWWDVRVIECVRLLPTGAKYAEVNCLLIVVVYSGWFPQIVGELCIGWWIFHWGRFSCTQTTGLRRITFYTWIITCATYFFKEKRTNIY